MANQYEVFKPIEEEEEQNLTPKYTVFEPMESEFKQPIIQSTQPQLQQQQEKQEKQVFEPIENKYTTFEPIETEAKKYTTFEPLESEKTTFKPIETSVRPNKPTELTAEYVSQDPELGEFKGFVWTLLGDYLNRGNFASANVADALLRGDYDLLGAAWKGLTGEEKRTYSDVLHGFGVNNTIANVAGLVLDIGLDPATWIPFGAWLKAGGKAIKGSKVAKAAKSTTVANKVKSVANDFFKFFDPSEGAGREFYLLKKYFQDSADYKVQKYINKVADWNKGIPKETRELMSRVVEGKEYLARLTKGQKDAYLKNIDQLRQFGKEAVDYKLITKESFDKWSGSYLPFRLADSMKMGGIGGQYGKAAYRNFRKHDSVIDYYDFYAKMKDDIAKVTTKQDAINIVTRKAPKGATVYSREAAEKMSLNELKSAVKKIDMPELDLATLVSWRGVEQIRETFRLDFVKKALDTWGRPFKLANKIKEVPEGMKIYIPRSLMPDEIFTGTDEVADYLTRVLRSPNVKGELLDVPLDILQKADDKLAKLGREIPAKYLVPDEIAHALNKTYTGLEVGGREVEDLVKALYDPFLNTWKGLVTVLRPFFHIRNNTSNIIQGWQSGTQAVNLIPRYITSIRGLRKANGTVATKSLGKLSYRQIYELADKFGAIKKGWVGAQSPSGVLIQIDNLLNGKKLGRDINPMEVGRWFGQNIEDLSRLATFSDELITTNQTSLMKAVQDAVHRTHKFHFDYSELSSFEQKGMKRIFPFYTWMRKNIPFQFQQLLEHPEQYSKIGKVHNALSTVTKRTADEKNFLPEWMEEEGYMKSPFKSEAGNPYYYNIDIPMKDLDTLFNLRDMVSSLSPLIKAPIEMTWGVKTFPDLGQKMTEPGREYSIAPAYMIHVPEAVKKAFGCTMWYDKSTGKRVLKMPTKVIYMMETIMPPLREVHNFMPQPIELLEDKAIAKAMGYPTGLQFRSVDVTKEKQNMFFEMKRLKEEIRKHYMETGIMDNRKQKRLEELIMKFKED